MKCSNLIMAALAFSAVFPVSAANLRVSNVAGSGAEYTTLADALAAAANGDCIILDGSSKSYGDIDIKKSVTLQGPGFFLTENGITQAGAASAEIGSIKIYAPNVQLRGLDQYGTIEIMADGVVINRCRIGGINFKYYTVGDKDIPAGSAVIHQNYITGWIFGYSTYYKERSSNVQVTNNIFKQQNLQLGSLDNSVISRNTFIDSDAIPDLKNCVFEHNLGVKASGIDASNSVTDNINHSYFREYQGANTDKAVREIDSMGNQNDAYGAFSGEDPYRLGGVPAGPVIESLELPESVELGSDFEVTVKIGKAK